VTAIALLGDVMLGRGVGEALDSTAPADLWEPELRDLLRDCDALVCNLECCIATRGSPTRRVAGKPFFFRSPPVGTESLRAIGTSAVGLANNHALDFETDALLDTLEHLGEAGIEACGAGPDAESARAGIVVGAGDLRLGIVAASDHPAEFAAGPSSPGIAYADLAGGAPSWLTGELARLDRAADRVLAFLHWGPNMTVRPERWQRRLADELLAAGADAVAGHSAHVFHGVALRPGGPVLHDLGDALDDYAVDAELRNDLGICAIWRPAGTPEVELIGLRLRFARTQIASGQDAEWIARRLARACGELETSVLRTGVARFELAPA
jgi:poly-gamma-glutamate capsule biosynthesis protein CapA/YwtB (metallophosphatase superfamily)